jgi:peptidoglycan/LPS O-acetylase OafA/YrhL
MANFLTTSPIIQDLVLPFVLIFTLLFAILEKSKLLGDDKKQINAIISFVLAGIFMAFSNYVAMIKSFSIVLIISLFAIFVFLLIWGFVWGDKAGDPLEKAVGIKWTIGIVMLIIVIVAVLKITGYWDQMSLNNEWVSNIVFIVFIVAAIASVLNQGSKDKDKK